MITALLTISWSKNLNLYNMKDKLQTIALGIFTIGLLFVYVFNLLIRIV